MDRYARVDCQVEPHEVGEVWALVAEHGREVVAPVLVHVDGAHTRAVAVQVAVDHRRDHRQLGDQVHRVFVTILKKISDEHVSDQFHFQYKSVTFQPHLPVRGLLHAVLVSLRELADGVAGNDGCRELRHRVKRVWEVADQMRHVTRQLGATRPLLGDALHLLLRRDLASHEQPEEALRKRLHAAFCAGQFVLAFGNAVSSEPNSFFRVKN